MLWMLVSSAFAAYTVNGNDGATQHACTAGETVNVNGNRNTVTITGDCGRVNVSGSENQVTLDGLTKLTVTGSQNQITWARNLSNKQKLPISDVGLQNHVSKR